MVIVSPPTQQTVPIPTTNMTQMTPQSVPGISSSTPYGSPESGVVKRKPGRPKKGEEVDKPPKIPKKRGRPKRNPTEEAKQNSGSSATNTLNHTLTSVVNSTKENASKQSLNNILNAPNTMSAGNVLASYPPTSAVVPGGSARVASDSWSTPTTKTTSLSGTSSVTNLLNSPAASSADTSFSYESVNSAKRPRGRPRKNPSPGEHVISPKTSFESNGEKKRRGRPRRDDIVAREYGLAAPVVSSLTLNPHNIQLSGDELDQFQIGESATSAEDEDGELLRAIASINVLGANCSRLQPSTTLQAASLAKL